MTLQNILQKFDKSPLGSAARAQQELQENLKQVQVRNERYFLTAVLLLVGFFIASWVLVFMCRDQPSILVAIFGALGGSVFGCVWTMTRMWQRKVATDYLLTMSDGLPPAEFKLVVRTLIKRL